MVSFVLYAIILSFGLSKSSNATKFLAQCNGYDTFQCCIDSPIFRDIVIRNFLECMYSHDKKYFGHRNKQLDMCESIFENIDKSVFKNLTKDNKSYFYHYKFTPHSKEQTLSSLKPSSDKHSYKNDRVKRQTTLTTEDTSISTPVDFLIKVAEHFQIREITFIFDLLDLKGNYFFIFQQLFLL